MHVLTCRKGAMSKELEKLEKRATQKYITDHEHIDRIIRYMFSLPLSSLKEYGPSYEYLCDDLCRGFNIFMDQMTRISIEDALILIGYEPGNPYFDPPDRKRMDVSKKFNAAWHSFLFADLIARLAQKNIRIKEFTHIGLNAYTDYIREKVENEYNNRLIPFTSCCDILYKIGKFKRMSAEYVMNHLKTETGSEHTITLEDLIYSAFAQRGRPWVFAAKPLDMYCNEMIESYDMLNSFIMDSLRMPLIRADRERFQEILEKYRDRMFDDPLEIDYERCYEHGGIIQK